MSKTRIKQKWSTKNVQVSEEEEDLVAAAAAEGVLDYRNPGVHCIHHEDLNLKERKAGYQCLSFESIRTT